MRQSPAMEPAERALIERSGLFRGLPAAAWDEIAGQAVRRAWERKAILFHQGDPAAALYLLTAGRVKLTQLGREGQEVILVHLGPGEALGAVAAVEGATYPVTAQAVEDTRTLLWPAETMRRLAAAYPALALNATRLMSERMREVQGRLLELSTERVAQRVARALLRLARQTGRKVEDGVLLDLPLSRQELAEMTGTTLFTVSRLLSQWESEGLLTAGREKVIIRSPHGLVAIAEDLPG